MSTDPAMSPLAPSPSSYYQSSKPHRVLACVRCQQRKVKCDRTFPCKNCQNSHSQCVPATKNPSRQRKRRFPERELLERLRKYEDLLQQNNIKFQPLHKDAAGQKEFSSTQAGDESDDEQLEAVGQDGLSPSTVTSERRYEPKNLWRALNSGSRDHDSDSDGVREVAVLKGWGKLFGDNDHLLFGSPNTNVDLSTLHPEPVQVFRLWQIYLDNVNSLLKVTHTPSLQGRIVEAASNLENINPTLEALLFGIYCVAILSLDVDDCQVIFASSREDLLRRFQFGCQQALLNCRFLRSTDRDCLTALYLYLVSVRPRTVPQSLSAMLGAAIRIAQRMGIDSESALAKCAPFDAELRRRLWWSLVLFDTRISEMADHKAATLAPTWDCKIPLNVDDSDLRPELKEPPGVLSKSTDALFAVVRSALGDFVRHTMFHLDFTNPALKPVFKTAQLSLNSDVVDLDTLEKMIEDRYLKICNPEIPFHFMTIWWARAQIARCRLWEYHSRYADSSMQPTDNQRDAAISHALRMLECDTKLMTSPLTKRFFWLIEYHFPFPSYIQILQDLKRRPGSEQAERAWEAMSDNYESRFGFLYYEGESPFYKIFAKIVLQAWEAREQAFGQPEEPLIPPRMISSVKQRMAEIEQSERISGTERPDTAIGMGTGDFPMSIPMGSSGNGMLHNMGGLCGVGPIGPAYINMPGQAPTDVDMSNMNWAAIDWGFGNMYPGTWNAGL
ncbi:related to C6 transcription factor [Phialocephala subalpina]|uniref:Related to C6 transcription factor n=1 Tax=Phialocephala subalpina TaxID=576137 RepID=A0A1L7X146_9HELO|nr:related to C6 transcription factor [Phialocephala subalpina]